MNGKSVAENLAAFRWGRCIAIDPVGIEELAESYSSEEKPLVFDSLDARIAHHADELTRYQDRAYAKRYRDLVNQVISVEKQIMPGSQKLSEAVATYFFKLMAYKDEYEVARLLTDKAQLAKMRAGFSDESKLVFHMSPPLIAPKDPDTGLPRKLRFGQWILPVMRVLSKAKFLRGTHFDPFGYMGERRTERTLIQEYETSMRALLNDLSSSNYAHAVEIALLPEQVRGYGHVKMANIRKYLDARDQLLGRWLQRSKVRLIHSVS